MENLKNYEYQMKTLGFYVIENFLNEEVCIDLINILNKELSRYKTFGTKRSLQDQFHLHDLICNHLKVAKLIENEELNLLLSKILGDYWIMYAFTSSSCPPHNTNFGGRIHVDSPRFIDNYVTNVGVIWALDDFTKINGATKVLPSSHNSEEIPSKELFDELSVDVIVPKGSLIIFNARLFHCTGFNETNEWRHALTMNACRPFMKQRMDWVRFVPSAISDNLNPMARRILGFDTQLPSSLEEFFLPDEKRLYKANQE